ncbi:MAG: hypothetical protein JW925_00465 [Syntrophaceae bacterium]|nr:hypothetical protein [Syntrophaceae bacterium]
MKKEKGISTWAVILIIGLLIGAGILWSRYFAKPMGTVMMQGADQAKPAIEKARHVSDAADRANKIVEEATKRLNDEQGK